MDVWYEIHRFTNWLGAWHWPFVVAGFAVAIGLALWLRRRRQLGRPIGSRGFTLLEIAIVLVIVGILLGAVGVNVKPVLDNARISETKTKMERIDLALLAYVMQNGCLPCPADPAAAAADQGWSRADAGYYGPNHATNNQPCASQTGGMAGTGCQSERGVAPWNNLAVRDNETVDGWQNRISYAVTPGLTISSSMLRVAPEDYPDGALTVQNVVGEEQIADAAYVLISHGIDRLYGYSARNGTQYTVGPNTASTSQSDNDPASTTATQFRQDREQPIEGGSYFDDIVTYRTAPAIIADCGKGACGNPS